MMAYYDNDSALNESVTALLSAEQIAKKSTVMHRLPGIEVEVLSTITPEDREVAAAAYGLAAELSGNKTPVSVWEGKAYNAMWAGGAVVRINSYYTASVNSFWREVDEPSSLESE